MTSPSVPRVTVAATVSGALVAALIAFAPVADAATPRIKLQRWSATAELATGSKQGTKASSGQISIAKRAGTTTYGGKKYDYARWTSPWTTAGFGANALIPSWNAKTPTGTMVKIQVRGYTTKGRVGSFDTIAYWASGDSRIKRMSGTAQSDDYSRVRTDMAVLNGGHRYAKWQIRAVLMRPTGSRSTPTVQSLGAVASLTRPVPATSRTTMTKKVELSVPRYSQMIHQGEYPQWNGGGQAWCSPTSTTMVLRYFRSGPTASQYAWVSKKYQDRFVDHAARYTFDYRYRGAGNWPFNTAYAGSFGMAAFVTRMADLRDAETFVKAGIPVVASIKFKKGQLTGAPISSTGGHVVVITGFSTSGKVVVADPAGSENSNVRRVYSRAQFERAWIGGSQGTAYVIRPASKKLPTSGGHARW